MSRKPPAGPGPTRSHGHMHESRPAWRGGAGAVTSSSSSRMSTTDRTDQHVRSQSLERRSTATGHGGHDKLLTSDSQCQIAGRQPQSMPADVVSNADPHTRRRTLSSSGRVVDRSSVLSGLAHHGTPSRSTASLKARMLLDGQQADLPKRATGSDKVSTRVSSQTRTDHLTAVRAKHSQVRGHQHHHHGDDVNYAGDELRTSAPRPKDRRRRSHNSHAASAASFAPSFSRPPVPEPATPAVPQTICSTKWDGSMDTDDANRGGWLYSQTDAPGDNTEDVNGGETSGSSRPSWDTPAGDVPGATVPKQRHRQRNDRQQMSHATKDVTAIRDHNDDWPQSDGGHQTLQNVSHSTQSLERSRPAISHVVTGRKTEVSGRGARVAELEGQVESLQKENHRLAADLKNMSDLYNNVTSASDSDLSVDCRRVNLLKSQIFQLERQVLLLSSALSKRADLIQESANTIDQVVSVLSHHQAESRKDAGIAKATREAGRPAAAGAAPKGVFIPQREFDESANPTPELDTALVFMSPYLKKVKQSGFSTGGEDTNGGKPGTRSVRVQAKLLDVCSGSLQHLNLKYVGILETELYQLLGDMLQFQAAMKGVFADGTSKSTSPRDLQSHSRAPTSRRRSAGIDQECTPCRTLNDDSTGIERHSFTSTRPASGRNASKDGMFSMTTACHLSLPLLSLHVDSLAKRLTSRLTTACDHLLGLTLLLPAAPFPPLEKTALPNGDWSTEEVLSQLPPNMRNKQELCKLLEALVKAVKYSLMMKDREMSSMAAELSFHQLNQQKFSGFIVDFMESVRRLVADFEEEVISSLSNPLEDILESYDHLKLSPSEDSLREFVQVFKDRADELSKALNSVRGVASGSSNHMLGLASQFADSMSSLARSHVASTVPFDGDVA